MSENVVIVGAGEAGGQTAISLRQGGYQGSITVVGDEAFAPYERPALSKQYLAGEMEIERMYMRAPAYYGEQNIALRLETTVTQIDRTARTVNVAGGEQIPYRWLVIATGGRVRRMTTPGAHLAGIFYLRTVADVASYRERLKPATKLVIVGGGYIGLEVAAVAMKRGCSVTVLEAQPLVLNRVVAPEMSRFYTDVHRAAGVDIRTSAGVTAFEGNGRIERVRCGNEVFAADMVIVGIGIIPNVELATAANLTVDNGIVVDEHARTSDPSIFAVGDCSNHPSALYGGRVRLESVPNALGQGKTAAGAILGSPTPYNEVPWFWSDQYDLKLQMTGLCRPGDQVVIRGDMAARKFSACYLRAGVFVACQCVNAAKDFLQSKKLIAAGWRPDRVALADTAVALKDQAAGIAG